MSAKQQNNEKAQKRAFKNMTHACCAKLHTFEDDNGEIVYGFYDVSFWIPSKQHWITPADPDKFQVRADDFETARSEFWARWKQYIKAQFGLNYIECDITRQ